MLGAIKICGFDNCKPTTRSIRTGTAKLPKLFNLKINSLHLGGRPLGLHQRTDRSLPSRNFVTPMAFFSLYIRISLSLCGFLLVAPDGCTHFNAGACIIVLLFFRAC